jgi:3-oxoacyl-[acyl-carrier-protein] synthase-3
MTPLTPKRAVAAADISTQDTAAADVGFNGVAAVLPPRSLDLAELARQGLIHSTPETLSGFGFERAYVATHEHDVGWLTTRAAREALADARLEAGEIDLLIWASALPQNHLRNTPPTSSYSSTSRGTSDALLADFRYAAGWMQQELGLVNADVMAVTQQGCSTMFSALRTARAMILAEPRVRNVLCVGVDVLPENAPREIMYNLISDAACAVVVSRGCPNERWLGYQQISHGYYWDPLDKQAEIIAAYFPTSRAVIEQLFESCKLTADDIDVIVPTGVNRSSWDILLRLVGIPKDRMHRGGESFGHTVSSDSFLHLQDIRRRQEVPRGSRVLLFTYGFGSTWCSLLLEH